MQNSLLNEQKQNAFYLGPYKITPELQINQKLVLNASFNS